MLPLCSQRAVQLAFQQAVQPVGLLAMILLGRLLGGYLSRPQVVPSARGEVVPSAKNRERSQKSGCRKYMRAIATVSWLPNNQPNSLLERKQSWQHRAAQRGLDVPHLSVGVGRTCTGAGSFPQQRRLWLPGYVSSLQSWRFSRLHRRLYTKLILYCLKRRFADTAHDRPLARRYHQQQR